MYEDRELIWFNQTSLSHQDEQFQTNAYLRVTYSINTSDLYNFNSLRLGFQISEDKRTRSYNLVFQDVVDLYKSFKQVMSVGEDSFNQGEFQIDKKYKRDQKLIFKFQKTKENEKVVTILIFYNESDFGKIIISFKLFEAIALIVKSFIENYDRIYGDLRRDLLLSKSLQVSQKLAGDIRNLPNQLVEDVTKEEVPIAHENNPQQVEDKEVPEVTSQLEELSEFVGEDMKNVPDIPEIKKLNKESSHSFSSKFLEQTKNLYEFERFLEASHISDNPLISVYNKLSNNKEVPLLSGISEKEQKSAVYLSKLFYLSYLRNHIEKDVNIPISFIDLKYKIETDKIYDDNLELAHDLLLIISYIKCFRNKVESKTNDADINKSKLYLALRCFCDIFTFSFLKEGDTISLVNNITSRFKHYDSVGFFNYYKGLLEDNNCKQINEVELESSISNMIEAIKETPFVGELHNNLFNNKQVILPSDNNFSTEQIINEVIPIEVDKQLNNGNFTKGIFDGKTSEVINLFKKSENSTEIIKESNLVRFIKEHKDEVHLKDEFWKCIEGFGDKNFDFKKVDINLLELDENVIKALYLWNPEDDSQVKNNYVYFCNRVENEIMGKNEIITSLEENDKNTSNSEDWFSNF